jgi:phosphate transport system substrate-binding protein
VNRLVVWALVAGLSVVVPSVGGSQDGLRLTGSGATFPFPLYSTWFRAFSAKQKGAARASRIC